MRKLFDENGEKTRRAFKTVCGRTFWEADPQYFPKAQYHGRAIYFCAESCLNAFLADPEPFYRAHNRSKTKKEEGKIE